MVEKCLEYLKAAEQACEVKKKISLNQQRMMLKDLSYEGLKSLLPKSQVRKGEETRSCKHISQGSQEPWCGWAVCLNGKGLRC